MKTKAKCCQSWRSQMGNLTKKQSQVYNAFVKYNQDMGRPPTLKDLSVFCFTSEQSIHRMLNVLVDKGYMEKGQKKGTWFNYSLK